MYKEHLPLYESRLAVSLKKAHVFEHYIQVMAHWTPPALSDGDGWEQLKRVYANLLRDQSITSGEARVANRCPNDPPDVPTLLFSLEDARVLGEELSRVDALLTMGFRIVTPLWRGVSCIGGAHDTDQGLTDFGRAALYKMATSDILLDVSHASERSFEEILQISSDAKFPPIASHSNAYTLCPVSRNLSDGQIRALLQANGIIGINLFTDFLRYDGEANVEDVLRHVEYFLSLGASDVLCLGCDLDGADVPQKLSDVSKLPLIAEVLLKHNYSETLIRALFFDNAYNFAKKYI